MFKLFLSFLTLLHLKGFGTGVSRVCTMYVQCSTASNEKYFTIHRANLLNGKVKNFLNVQNC